MDKCDNKQTVLSFRFDLDMIEIKAGFKEALTQLKASRPELKAICMGTRRTDPHSGQSRQLKIQ